MGENGKRLIDRLVAAMPTDRRSFTIPELGETIYFRPITKAEMEAAMPTDKVDRPAQKQGLFLLVHLAENEAGEKLFKKTDIEKLYTKVNALTLMRIEEAMYGIVAPDIKDAEAIIEADPPSASA